MLTLTSQGGTSAMHITDYLVLGLLIASMLRAAAVVLSRSKNRGGGKRRGVNKQRLHRGS